MTTYLKKEKNKAPKKALRVFLVICLLFTGVIAYGVYWAFFDMNRLPKGEYLIEKTSPGGHYTLKAYLTNRGATTSYAVRGELVFNEGNKSKPKIFIGMNEKKLPILPGQTMIQLRSTGTH